MRKAVRQSFLRDGATTPMYWLEQVAQLTLSGTHQFFHQKLLLLSPFWATSTGVGVSGGGGAAPPYRG